MTNDGYPDNGQQDNAQPRNGRHGHGQSGLVPADGATPKHPALGTAERRQRNLIIALSVGSVIVLVAGMIAFVATRGGNGSTATSTSLPIATVATTEPTPTTDPPTTTGATTTTTPPTTMVLPAVAQAGDDLAVDRSVEFTLSATNLAAGTPNAAVRWTQTAGPDVTAGVGSLRGASAVAIAPPDVATLQFTLEVAGTDGVATDDVVVRVFEDADQAVFVDGERGDDGADGSIGTPFRTLAAAVQAAAGRDLYVRSVGTYDTAVGTIELTDGVSLYGGFDAEWTFDSNRRTVIKGAAIAVRTTGSATRWLSAIEVTADDATPGNNSAGIVVEDAGTLHVVDSRIVGGDGGAGVDGGSGGRSSGVFVDSATEVRIERSTVNAGSGGRGADGVAVVATVGAAATGGNASGRAGGVGGGSGPRAGGRGGDGGTSSSGSNAPGGGIGGTASAPNGRPGTGGAGGNGGVGGDGGVGLAESGDDATLPVGQAGGAGESGLAGAGGTGGGGGYGPPLVDGGGGAGGGAGGAPTEGAGRGAGGGGSIGLWTTGVERLVVIESLIAGGSGGDGGAGAVASAAQVGGPGGRGAAGADGVLADGGRGGGGGGGGGGGTGGQGGGGAGGPSFGMLTTRVTLVEISATTVRGGGGGNGADGGLGGASGLGGADGSGVDGGAGGSPVTEARVVAGAGAAGGSSYGWFDDDAATQAFDGAEFVEGVAGNGGTGSNPGDDGVQVATNN